MVLPVSPNAISANQINVEVSRTSTTSMNLNDTVIRDLIAGNITTFSAPYTSGSTISFDDAHGKEAPFAISVASNTTQLDVRSYLVSNGWDQNKRVVLTINSGVVITSGSYAVIVSGSFPNGIRIINNGLILGSGGAGGTGGGGYGTTTAGLSGGVGSAGGRALYASTPVVILNYGSIYGGGGGGGGGRGLLGTMNSNAKRAWAGGAGGGGGAGYGAGAIRGITQVESPIISGSTQPTNGFSGGGTGGGGGSAGNFAFNDGSGSGFFWNGGSAGGNGGAFGASGGSGTLGANPFGAASFVIGTSGSGGPGGIAITGSNYVTFWVTGTIAGGTQTI